MKKLERNTAKYITHPKHILSFTPLFLSAIEANNQQTTDLGESGQSYGSEAFPQDSVPDPNPDPDPPDPRVFGFPDPDPLVRNMDPDPSIMKQI
jgi:hypothetical protein